MAASTFFLPVTISGGTAGTTVASDTGKTGQLVFVSGGTPAAPTTGQIWPRGQGT